MQNLQFFLRAVKNVVFLLTAVFSPNAVLAQELSPVPGAFVLRFPSESGLDWSQIATDMRQAIEKVQSEPTSYIAPAGDRALVFSDLYPDLSCAAAWPDGDSGLSELVGHSEENGITGHFRELGSYFSSDAAAQCFPEDENLAANANSSVQPNPVDIVLRAEIPKTGESVRKGRLDEIASQFFWNVLYAQPVGKSFSVAVCPVLRFPSNPVGSWHAIQPTSLLLKSVLDRQSAIFRFVGNVSVNMGAVSVEIPTNTPVSSFRVPENYYFEILIRQSSGFNETDPCDKAGRTVFHPDASLVINWQEAGSSALNSVFAGEDQFSPTTIMQEVIQRSSGENTLNEPALWASSMPGVFVVEGYADTLTGTDDENLAISERRAERIADFLNSSVSGSKNDEITLLFNGFGETNAFDAFSQSTGIPSIKVFENYQVGDYDDFSVIDWESVSQTDEVVTEKNRVAYVTWFPFQEPPHVEPSVAASKWLAAQQLTRARESSGRPACPTQVGLNKVLSDLDKVVEYFYSDRYLSYSDIAAHQNVMVLICSGRELDVNQNHLRSGYLRPETVAPFLLRAASDNVVSSWPVNREDFTNDISVSPIYEIESNEERSFILFGDTILAHFFDGTDASELIDSSFCNLGSGTRIRVAPRDRPELDFCDPAVIDNWTLGGRTELPKGLYDIHVSRWQSEAEYCTPDHSVFEPARIDEAGLKIDPVPPSLDRSQCRLDGTFPNIFEVFEMLTALSDDGEPLYDFLLRAAVDVAYEFSTELQDGGN